MTRFSKLSLFLLIGALSLAITGCTRKTKHPTPIPGYTGGPSTEGTPAEPVTPKTTPGGGKLGTDPGAGGVDSQALGNLKDFEGRPLNTEILKADTIYFEYDRARIQTGERSKLTAVADYLKANPTHDLLVEGHCDERGTEEYNRALGERRALAAREFLGTLGVAGSRVRTLSHGEDRPVEQGHDEAAWSKNRRAEFGVLLPKTQ
jgi:peptidoglycan-associated lipoprotein